MNNSTKTTSFFSENIRAQINQCFKDFGQEASKKLLKQLALGEDLTDRKNFNGHTTGSCFLLSPDSTKILCIHNLNLDRKLQPGGHCEQQDDAPINTAVRELEEEVGVGKLQYDIVHPSAIDVDTHLIPENPKKKEPAHFHHDFRHLFRLKHAVEINLDLNEVSSYQWVPINDCNFIPSKLLNRIKLILKKNK